MKKGEILAPGGDLEKLMTAIDFGADAVYIAGQQGGLRTASKNFTDEELKEGLDYAKKNGAKVYITLNILPHDNDLKGLPEYLEYLEELKPDGLIISDPGIFMLAKKHAPSIDRHISTQASVTNAETVNFWHSLGAKRIVLARELSLEEIIYIRENIDPEMELEVFVHGAMCIAYSGRCLLSSYMTGRDANRGDCAHTCRWKYSLVEERRQGEYFPIEENEKGSYILNSKDLCLLPYLNELIEAGIDSFKIEGRVKSEFYLATTVRAYKMARDAIYEKRFDGQLKEELMEELQKCSHREFTTAFLRGKPEDDRNFATSGYIRDYDYIGKVFKVTKDRVYISQRNKFYEGDKVEALMAKEGIVKFNIEDLRNNEGELIGDAPHPEQKVSIKYIEGLEEGAILRRKK